MEALLRRAAPALALLLACASRAGALCRPDMADVDGAFCIDRYEAGLAELRDDGKLVAWPPNQVPRADGEYWAVNGRGRVPQAYISGEAASAACARSSKRLCTSTEWLKACSGASGRTYPYGAAYRAQACNEHWSDPKHRDPLARLFGRDHAYDTKTMNDPRIDLLDGTVAPSGSDEYKDCVSAYGVYDLVGNLHEWTADVSRKGKGVFRGGYFNDAELHGDGCTYKTTAHLFTYHDYSTGFRCCGEPLHIPQRTDFSFDGRR